MAKYKGPPLKEDIGVEDALIHAARALGAAGEIAERNSDCEGMLSVAAMWMKYGEALNGYVESVLDAREKEELKDREGEMVKAKEPKIDIGFQKAPVVTEPITVEEELDD